MVVAEILPNEGFDFLSRRGDEPDWPGEEERHLVGQGDTLVMDRGERQYLAVLSDRENQVFTSNTLRNNAANRARDRLASPGGGLLPGPTARRQGMGGGPRLRARSGTRLVQNTGRFEITVIHRRVLAGPSA